MACAFSPTVLPCTQLSFQFTTPAQHHHFCRYRIMAPPTATRPGKPSGLASAVPNPSPTFVEFPTVFR
jgi:hypothetical protein